VAIVNHVCREIAALLSRGALRENHKQPKLVATLIDSQKELLLDMNLQAENHFC
jgi:hypothetical protein